MLLGVLPGLKVYTNVSTSGMNANIQRDTHTNEYKLQA